MLLKGKLSKYSSLITLALSVLRMVLPLVLSPDKAQEIISIIEQAIFVTGSLTGYGIARKFSPDYDRK